MNAKPRRRPSTRPLWLAAYAAVLAAVGFVRFRAAAVPPVLTGDSTEYLEMARHLASARTLAFEPVVPFAGRAPMYPVLLQLGAGADGVRPARAAWIHAALMVLLAAGAGALAVSLHSPAAGALAAVFVGFHPALATASGLVGVELLFALCAFAVAWAMALDAARPDLSSAVLAAVAVGASLWCRSTFLFLPPLLSAAALRSRDWRRAAILLLLPYLVLAPWTLRNDERLGAFIPVERQAGVYNLLHAASGDLGGSGDEASAALAEKSVPGWRDMDDVERESALYRFSARKIAESPFRYAVSCLRRAWLLWRPQWLLVLGAAWAFWRLRGRPEVAALGWLWGYFNIYASMGVEARYAWPAVPFLCALAACGLADLFAAGAPQEDRARRLSRGAAAWLAGPALLTACSAWALAVEGDAVRAVQAGRGPAPSCPRAESRPGLLADAKRAQDRGVLLYLHGDARRAAECFRAALWVEPRYAAARLGAATALSSLGDKRDALTQADAAVRLLEADGERSELLESALSARAAALRAAGRGKDARADEAAAARLNAELSE
ncbi:MAG: glycosyltransferase family 39 protein [Elusimicrobia bacterium]|nr:glycosyltransferase family 39 protein [Elusimicrobiota bacterium]